jgi:hypothetical protein
LYEYLNGGAEAFHNYDMAAMVHQLCRVEGVEVTIDIYDMAEPLNAFGVYSSERAPNYRFLPIGAEGYASASALNFLQGPFYVKLSASGPKAAPVMESLAQAISKRIGDGSSLPASLAWFAQPGLIPRSHKYVKRAPLGHEFLAPAFMASYKVGRAESLLAVSEAASPAEAQQRFERLRRHFNDTGKAAPWPPLPGACRGRNSLEGDWIFLARGRRLAILVNPPPTPVPLLKELLGRLPSP